MVLQAYGKMVFLVEKEREKTKHSFQYHFSSGTEAQRDGKDGKDELDNGERNLCEMWKRYGRFR